ncbi:hypothetical protein D0B54_07030 [Solimonas sp. K1W22B-7]|uniref:hypothetical protein n=1 Tax=Solimonas sp. K1W22B-7 TaxID=2303331 RepID=UPI000E336B5A|nr:hypothetical protein [Solimonas sp. K1W22B-7]AXQ28449.1 hypothetical protein D0B54_07030 [Solimonas sp. K1W22B-7]
MLRYATLSLALLLAACGGSSAPDTAAPAPVPEPTPETQALALNCSWLLRSDPDLLNIAFPDEAATYWVAALPALPGTRLRIEGEYPRSRYFSYNAYDPALRPTDAITDYQLDPAAGGNPYRSADAAGGRYVAYLKPGMVPEPREPNTLYAGSIDLLNRADLPNPLWLLIYRVYLAEGSRSGGVPLPKLTLETAGGTATPIALESCNPLPPEGLPGLVNGVIRDSSNPLPLPFPLAPKEPQVLRFYGLPEALRQLVSNAVGFPLPLGAITGADTGGGFLSNVDNAYVTSMASRDQGSLYIVRARAPSHALRPSDAPLGSAQLRYWSLCTNEFVSQRYVDCLSDYEVPVDAQGYFTLVVSDPAQRPSNATDAKAIAWLPWGSVYPDSVLIYRHMLPSPHFAQAVQNIPYGTPPVEVMGEYLPKVAYCDRATIEAAGSAAQAFEACAAE